MAMPAEARTPAVDARIMRALVGQWPCLVQGSSGILCDLVRRRWYAAVTPQACSEGKDQTMNASPIVRLAATIGLLLCGAFALKVAADSAASYTSARQAVPGVFGHNTANGDGVFGKALTTGRGVLGVSESGAGVEGHAKAGRGVVGTSDTQAGVEG
jgi:hypothetical protein